MRIISICPSNTELVGYLGLTSQLVAVDNYSDWPKEVQQLPRVGPDLQIDMEKVESLNPDLVIASLSVPGMEKNIDALVERNIPHIVFNPNSLDEISDNLLELGKVTNCEEKAKQLTQRYKAFISQYDNISKQVKRPSIYWEWWPKPIFTPGKTNWLSTISKLAGGNNLFDDHNKPSVQTNWEDVLERNPDHICLVWVGVQQDKINPALVKKRPGWDQLNAIKQNNLYVLDEPLFCRPSPRLLLGLKKIASIIHPNDYPAYDGVDPLLD